MTPNAVVRSRATLAVLALLGSVSSLARAEGAQVSPAGTAQTILLVDTGDNPWSTRMSAELGTLGFEVKATRVLRATCDDSEVELLSQTVKAVATLCIDRDLGQVRVWTVDAPGRLVLRAVVAMEQEPAVVALRAVEALRTSLHAVEGAAAANGAVAGAPARHEEVGGKGAGAAAEAREPPALDVSVGPAVAASAGNAQVTLHGLVSAHWLLERPWGIEAALLAPLIQATWKEAEGSASLVFGLAAAGVHLRPFERRWCVLDFGADLGAALLHATGSPAAGFVGRSGDQAVASPLVRAGFAVLVAGSVWLRTDVIGAVAVPRPVFTFAGRSTGSWGQPLVLASLGIEFLLR